ncbi:hypothetical protein DPMN_165663 [Dreissena polymorpha]|uniref:Uncharacterized protein n=1 Tax=Dreissena polymorpha TaxID=45954 RepID=A0A9D4EX88_DREPO|nr:hypothetical protein DPMN_165663 [Dreissena polymorpha]
MARQKLYTRRRELKSRSGHDQIFINEDLTQHRAQLLSIKRGLVRSKNIKSPWSADGKNGQSIIKRIICASELEQYKSS